MPSILDKYPKHHQFGLDCRITCLRNTLDYFGIKESYATVFGMSSSFNFVYRKDKFTVEETVEMPDCDFSSRFYPISGHRFDCMEKLAYVYSATTNGDYPDDADTSFERIRELLRARIPPMVALSRRALCELLGRQFGTPPFLGGLEFGGHWVIVVGIEDRTDAVTLFETDYGEPITISREQFQRARSEGDDDDQWFLKSRNRWFVFIPPEAPPVKTEMIRTALTRTVFHMRRRIAGRRVYVGLQGLHLLADEMPCWHVNEEFSADQMKGTVWMMHLQSEVVSSGGLGRRLFASYLTQASRLCRSDYLQSAAEESTRSSLAWREVIKRATKLVLDEERTDLRSSDEFRPLLSTIVESESAMVENVSRFLEQG